MEKGIGRALPRPKTQNRPKGRSVSVPDLYQFDPDGDVTLDEPNVIP
jgi:hypothetical protein